MWSSSSVERLAVHLQGSPQAGAAILYDFTAAPLTAATALWAASFLGRTTFRATPGPRLVSFAGRSRFCCEPPPPRPRRSRNQPARCLPNDDMNLRRVRRQQERPVRSSARLRAWRPLRLQSTEHIRAFRSPRWRPQDRARWRRTCAGAC